jgi:hypothetical protein
MFDILFNKPKYVKDRVYRVVFYQLTGNYSTGSGFFIDKTHILTCFHVAFGNMPLGVIRQRPDFLSITGLDEHTKLRNFYNALTSRVEIELQNGKKISAQLENFDEKHDIALLNIDPGFKEIKICKINFNKRIKHGGLVYFGGFPLNHDYQSNKNPFAFHKGIISSFGETTLGGEKYEHVLLHAISLPGNSGSPVFLNPGLKVIGIINGTMNYGRDDIAVIDALGNYNKSSLRSPIGITYATTMSLLKQSIILANFLKSF